MRTHRDHGRTSPLRWAAWLSGLVVVLMLGLSGSANAAPPPAKPKAQSPKKAAATPASKAKAKKAAETTTPDPMAAGAAKKDSGVRQSDLYGDRLDSLQGDVDGLKDRIFRSKARLSLLKETVLRGVLAGSRVILAHRNLMGSGFKLVRIVYVLDGAQIDAKTDESGGLDSEDELVIYDGNLPPGPHNVQVELTYKGHGYGVFSYLAGYTYSSESSYTFTAPENGSLKVTSAGYEEGNLTTEMDDRPKVDWQEVPLDASGRPLPKQRRRSKKSSKKPGKKPSKKPSKKKK